MKNTRITLVLMAGLPGAGKTTLACALSEEFQWRVVDKDKYRLRWLEQGWDDNSASWRAYETSFDEIRSALMKQGVSIIFDTAALDRSIVDTTLEIAHSVEQVRVKVILCVADRDLRNERLRNRRDPSTRIRVDPATIADYLRYFRHLPSHTLIIYTSAPFDECLNKAKAYLENDTC